MTDPSNITGDDDPGEGPNSEADATPPDDPNIADTTQAEAINNGFIARQQQLLYTDPNAFYRKTGEDALIGTPGILDQLQDLHRKTLDLVPTPGVRQRLQSALDSHLALSRDDVLRHTRREAKAWQATTAQNRIGLLTKQAALQYNDLNSVAAYAFAAANAGRAHARATNGDADASAAAAASSVWRNAIESAVARDDTQSAGTLHADAGGALGPTDAAAVAGQLAAAQERMRGFDMTTVYKLLHLEAKRADGFQDYKPVGVYSTRKKAEEAIERYRDLPGFRDYPERWHIKEMTLDETDWANGFDKETHQRLP